MWAEAAAPATHAFCKHTAVLSDLTVTVSVDHLVEEGHVLQAGVRVGCCRSNMVLNVYSVSTAYQKILEGLQWFLCPSVSAAQSQCYQTSYHHPMRAARLVHTTPNQWACLLGQREAHDCKSVLFPSSTPILFWVWGRESCVADLIAQATDPAPHPEETEEKNNERSQCWRPANIGRGGSCRPSNCDPVAQNSVFTTKRCVTALLLQLQCPSPFSSCHAVSTPSLFQAL